MVDDAHGFGVLGEGRGSAFEYHPHPDVPLQMGTLESGRRLWRVSLRINFGYRFYEKTCPGLIYNRATAIGGDCSCHCGYYNHSARH